MAVLRLSNRKRRPAARPPTGDRRESSELAMTTERQTSGRSANRRVDRSRESPTDGVSARVGAGSIRAAARRRRGRARPRSTTGGFRSSGRPARTSSSRPTSSPTATTSLAAVLLYRQRGGDGAGARSPMAPLGNDRWRRVVHASTELGALRVHGRGLGRSLRDLAARARRKKIDAGQDVVERAARGRRARARTARERSRRRERARLLAGRRGAGRRADRQASASRRAVGDARRRDGARAGSTRATRYDRDAARDRRARARALRRLVRDVPALGRDRSRRAARRSTRPRRGCPTSRRWASTSLYLPPIHPIGRSFRKGRNNTLDAGAGRSRQPVGDRRRGRRPHGHRARARHARRLRSLRRGGASGTASRSRSTSPSRARPIIPRSREHPEWFRHRPDGTIKYAENPPKKYQDIYPIDFESRGLARRSGTS